MKIATTVVFFLAATGCLFAQNVSDEIIKARNEDLSITKAKAESGDINAQLSLADTLSFNLKKADAQHWYRKAAEGGLVEAKSRLGEMLLFGSYGAPASESVAADPVEGIRWTFEAATNGNVQARLNLSRAYQSGVGVSTNPVEAYAWLKLYAEATPGRGTVLLNQLALSMDTKTLDQGKQLAEEFKAGHWPDLSPRRIAAGSPGLKLQGIVFGGKVTLATINGHTVQEGETFEVQVNKDSFEVKCLQIRQNCVQVLIEGESEPHWLCLQ